MSLVVAIKSEGKVYLGADTQVTCGFSRETYKNKNNYKIWDVLNVKHCVMGHVGSSRNSNVVRLIDNLVPEIDQEKDVVSFDYVYNRIMPYIIDELKDAEFLDDEKILKDGIGSSFFFAYKDKLFLINGDRSVFEIDDYCAIGAGDSEAYGSLLSTEGEDPKIRIIKALTAGSKRNIYVSYPIVITDTDSQKYQILNDKTVKKYLVDSKDNTKSKKKSPLNKKETKEVNTKTA